MRRNQVHPQHLCCAQNAHGNRLRWVEIDTKQTSSVVLRQNSNSYGPTKPGGVIGQISCSSRFFFCHNFAQQRDLRSENATPWQAKTLYRLWVGATSLPMSARACCRAKTCPPSLTSHPTRRNFSGKKCFFVFYSRTPPLKALLFSRKYHFPTR